MYKQTHTRTHTHTHTHAHNYTHASKHFSVLSESTKILASIAHVCALVIVADVVAEAAALRQLGVEAALFRERVLQQQVVTLNSVNAAANNISFTFNGGSN